MPIGTCRSLSLRIWPRANVVIRILRPALAQPACAMCIKLISFLSSIDLYCLTLSFPRPANSIPSTQFMSIAFDSMQSYLSNIHIIHIKTNAGRFKDRLHRPDPPGRPPGQRLPLLTAVSTPSQPLLIPDSKSFLLISTNSINQNERQKQQR